MYTNHQNITPKTLQNAVNPSLYAGQYSSPAGYSAQSQWFSGAHNTQPQYSTSQTPLPANAPFWFVPESNNRVADAASYSRQVGGSERSESPLLSSFDDKIENDGKSSKWTEDQTKVLVKSWKEKLVMIEGTRNKEGWREIVSEVNKAGSTKTTKQCKDKLKNLKKQYKDAKDNNKETGRARQWSPFFADFDEVLSSRPVMTTPGVVQIGQKRKEEPKDSQCSSSSSGESLDDSVSTAGDISEDDSDDDLQFGGKKKGTITNKAKNIRKTKADEFDTLTELFVQQQKEQNALLMQAQKSTETFLLTLKSQQRKADEEARKRDQEFMLRMAEILKK